MSGFFKKLFNRITGRKDEPAPAPEPELEKLPAPEPAPPQPEPEPEPVAPVPEPVVIATPEPKKPEPKAKAKPEPKKVEAKKPEPKKPEPRKVEVKKPEPPKAKVEPKKPEPKKPEPKKPEPKKPELKKPEPKKPEPKKPEPKAKAKPEPKKVEAEKPAPVAKKIVEPLPPPPPPPPEPEPVIEVAVPEPEAIIEAVVVPEPEVIAEPEPPKPEPEPAPEPEPERKGWFARLKDGLAKSSKSITGSITAIFTKRKLDAATLQELEDVLLQADLGLPMAERILKAVSTGRYDKEIDPEEVKQILASEVAKVLKPVEVPFNFGSEKPFVILVVGVNGAGKTTTIGKLGAIATGEGFKVMFAACDTFRAAAIEQLTIWGQRIGAKTISRPTGADASGLAFDAMTEARESGTDILFIDTAGRLQNKAYLMDELDKVVRVIKKQDEAAPHAVLLVLDATTGQNALAQADIFTKVAGVTGLIMTKLDGTARGGILVAIAEKFKLPVHAIGVGEQIDDLQPFDAEGFARAIAGLEDA
jgi:fused signal recognition particle receptor